MVGVSEVGKGSVAFSRDLSGLAQLAETNLPVVVVGVDNGGGQIFRDLPFASDVALEDFVSPRSTDLGAVASALGYRTIVAEDRGSFAQGFAALAAAGTPGFLHAKLAPEACRVAHFGWLMFVGFPPDIREYYNRHKIVTKDGYIFIRIKKAMYGLKQAAILAYKHIKNTLEPHGYYPVIGTVGL